ncbi:hypothetical protein QBC34DRAFT_150484, partial [Podospora aff. communis PSN243]
MFLARVGCFSVALASFPASLHTSPVTKTPVDRLETRGLDEYVVLANCISDDGVRSSQMAYYPGSPNASPNVVAQTSYGQTSVWEYSATAGRFDDGNVFTATIGPPVAQGEFAGTGKASQGSFSCWRNHRKNLYNWAEHLCTGIYDCNRKSPPPPPAPSSLAPTTSPLVTPLVVPTTLVVQTSSAPLFSSRETNSAGIDTGQRTPSSVLTGGAKPQETMSIGSSVMDASPNTTSSPVNAS